MLMEKRRGERFILYWIANPYTIYIRIATCLNKFNQLSLIQSINVSFYEVKNCVTLLPFRKRHSF